jgi:signal transduction histidine kinase
MSRPRPSRAAIADAAIVLALVVSAAYDVWGRDVAEPDPRSLVFLLVAATLAPLGWRRRAPLPVLLGVMAGVGVHTLAFGQWSSFQYFVALVLAVFSVAAYAERKQAAIGIALAAALFAAASAAKLAAGDPFSEIPGPFVVLAAVVVGGRALARRRAEADRLRELNVDLERRKEADSRAAVEAERARIARELHDVVAHAVSVIVVQAQAADRVLEGEQTSARESLHAIESTARTALVEMRRLLELLRPEDEGAGLVPQPGLDQLGALVTQVREAGLDVDLRVEGERRAVPAGVDLSAFRIVQEALTNVLKHAGPARAAVTLRYRPGEIELEVVDDGAAARSNGRGHGLLGMRERAAVVGGRVETGPRDGRGYAVRASLPT